MKIGDDVKVLLPGESPWVVVEAIIPDGFVGRINNKLFREYSEFEKAQWINNTWDTAIKLPELHPYSRGDLVCFTKFVGPEYEAWAPAIKAHRPEGDQHG